MKLTNLLILSLITLPLSVAAQLEKSDDSFEPRERVLKKHHKGHRGKKAQHILKRVDANEDGKIDLSEYLADAEQRFQAMDQNNNGFVVPEEMRAYAKEMRIRHRKAMKEARKAYRESKGLGDDAGDEAATSE